MKSPIYALDIEGRGELRREDLKERKEKKLRLRLLERGGNLGRRLAGRDRVRFSLSSLFLVEGFHRHIAPAKHRKEAARLGRTRETRGSILKGEKEICSGRHEIRLK